MFFLITSCSVRTFYPTAGGIVGGAAGSLGGPTPAQLQSYMDNPEQFQRQMTASERAIKALQTPNLSPEVQENIAKWANADAGMGGTKIALHEPSGQWIMTSSTGVAKMLGPGGKSTSEKTLEYRMARDKALDLKDKVRSVADLKAEQMKYMQEYGTRTATRPGDESYEKVNAQWESIIAPLEDAEGVVREYDETGKRIR